MVTIEQGDGQFQGTGGTTATRNPQQAPGNLQINGIQESNLQGVITGTSLFNNPQSNAVIKVSGDGSTTNVESLLASESAPKTTGGLSAAQSGAFVGIVALVVLVGGFLIIKRFTSNN